MGVYVEVGVGDEAEVVVLGAVEVEHDPIASHEARIVADGSVAIATLNAIFARSFTLRATVRETGLGFCIFRFALRALLWALQSFRESTVAVSVQANN